MPNKYVTHIIVNNLGGITSVISNLIRYRGNEALPQELVLLNIAGNVNTPALLTSADGLLIKEFFIHPRHNWYYTYGRMAQLLSNKEGVLVSNDVYDLIMLSHYNVPRKVVQIVHDGYNVKLSVQYEEVVDAFICHSLFFYEILCQLLPHRRADIFHIPYGISLQHAIRKSRLHNDRLHLLFMGRHDVNKGVLDLYTIHRLLQQKNIQVDWLILGKGPETERLKQQWQGEQAVQFHTPATSEEVMKLVANQDILVFPTKFEGFPVALTEAMSTGCVPVVSDLPGGIREIVQQGETGFRCAMNDNDSFADYIAQLHVNRNRLEEMSKKAYDTVFAGYDAAVQSPRYQELFNRMVANTTSPRHHGVKKKLGSRLDQPWIPNSIVRYLRKVSG